MIRFGIIGAGGIAAKFARDIKLCPNAIATSIASRDLEKANIFKNEHNLEFAFGSYEEMALSDKIDAVYIAVPHNFHMEYSIMFMNHKKHVLCEKPIAVNVKEFEKMVKSAKENNVLLMEAMWTKFLPATVKVREVIASKVLGKFKHAYLEFGVNVIEFGGDTKRWLNPNLAGGSLLDVGVYPVAYTLNITDQEVKSIEAKAKFYKTGIDLECFVDFVYEDNSTTRLISSFNEDKNNPGLIEFEHGKIVVENFSRSEKVVINNEEYVFPHLGEGFSYQINSFSETIEKGLLENEIMTHDQSRKSMMLLDRIREVIGLKYPFE